MYYWKVSDTLSEHPPCPTNDAPIRIPRDGYVVIGPFETKPHPALDETRDRVKAKNFECEDLAHIERKLEMLGNTKALSWLAQALEEKRRVRGTTLRCRAISLGVAPKLRSGFANTTETIDADGMTLTGADIYDAWITELAERGSIAVNDPHFQGFLKNVAGLTSAEINALCAPE